MARRSMAWRPPGVSEQQNRRLPGSASQVYSVARMAAAHKADTAAAGLRNGGEGFGRRRRGVGVQAGSMAEMATRGAVRSGCGAEGGKEWGEGDGGSWSRRGGYEVSKRIWMARAASQASAGMMVWRRASARRRR